MKTLSRNLLLGDKPMRFGLWFAIDLIGVLLRCGAMTQIGLVVAVPGHLLIGKLARSNRLKRHFA
ncbi:MAG: hypothetical protein EON58_16015 [Alphaproteobacteria bacterium]|nr:MAG: hypothetical protein EON58_16015 [Alphaproteobacteria bacterium]